MKNYKEVIDKLMSRNQRLTEDYENLKRQKNKEIDLIRKTASRNVIQSLLPVVDDMERLITNVCKDTTVSPETKKAIALLYGKTASVLKNEGVTVIPTVGQQFNPYIHEAVGVSSGEENIISKCVRTGYMLNEEIIRHPHVYVNKKS